MKDLNTAELGHMREIFDRCDSNGDGWITGAEFGRLLQGLDQDLSEAECLLAFEATDNDGDGSISFEEFLSWWNA